MLIDTVNKNGIIDILKLKRYMASKNSQEVAGRNPSWLDL